MQTREWTFRDRSDWRFNPHHEPDKRQWLDEASGLPCLAVRNFFGAWCGYVGVPKEHPWHGTEYFGCTLRPRCGESYCGHSPELQIEVHGGLTFSDACTPDDKEHGICHVPDAGEPDDVWWFGFDTAHWQDLIPGMPSYVTRAGGTYRDLSYVERECVSLAQQLRDAA